MKKIPRIAAVALLGLSLALSVGAGVAAGCCDRSGRGVLPAGLVSIDTVIQAAEHMTAGRFVRAELHAVDKDWVYRIVLLGRDGLQESRFDARSGRHLSG